MHMHIYADVEVLTFLFLYSFFKQTKKFDSAWNNLAAFHIPKVNLHVGDSLLSYSLGTDTVLQL